MSGLLWREALLLCDFPSVTTVVSQDDGGGFIECSFFNFINRGSKDGAALDAAQEGSFGIETFQNIPFDNNGLTFRVAGIKQTSSE